MIRRLEIIISVPDSVVTVVRQLRITANDSVFMVGCFSLGDACNGTQRQTSQNDNRRGAASRYFRQLLKLTLQSNQLRLYEEVYQDRSASNLLAAAVTLAIPALSH